MLVKGFCPDFVAKNADFNAKRRLYGFFPVHKMESWMQSEGRKPLILRGARQTGKTTLVRDFGQKFDSFIELNLEKKSRQRPLRKGVARYAATRDMAQLKPVYESLITSYKDDVPKYANTLSEANVIRHVIETAPYETGRRIKFERFGNGNYKSRQFATPCAPIRSKHL